MLEIKMTKLLLAISEQELLKCLSHEPAILLAAVKRGKSVARAIKEQNRKPKGAFHNDKSQTAT